MAKTKPKLVEVMCIVPYFDLKLKKDVRVGDVLEVSPARADVLKEKRLVK